MHSPSGLFFMVTCLCMYEFATKNSAVFLIWSYTIQKSLVDGFMMKSINFLNWDWEALISMTFLPPYFSHFLIVFCNFTHKLFVNFKALHSGAKLWTCQTSKCHRQEEIKPSFTWNGREVYGIALYWYTLSFLYNNGLLSNLFYLRTFSSSEVYTAESALQTALILIVICIRGQ